MMFYALVMTYLPRNDVHALLVRKGRHRSRHIRFSCTGMALGCTWCGCVCGSPTLLRYGRYAYIRFNIVAIETEYLQAAV